MSMAFVPDGNILVSSYGDDEDSVRVWQLGSKPTFTNVRFHRGGSGYVLVAAGDTEGAFATMTTVDNDEAICIWDVSESLPRAKLRGFKAHPRDFVFLSATALISVGGMSSVDGSDKGELLIWNTATGRSRILYTGEQGLTAIAASPIGQRIATGDYDGRLAIWDLAADKTVRTIQAHDETVNSVSYSSDGRLIASASHGDPAIKIWEASKSDPVSVLPGSGPRINQVRFQPGLTVVAAAGSDGAVSLWDAVNGEKIGEILAGSQVAQCLAFSPDGSKLAIGCDNGTIEIWELREGSETSKK